jgi:3alpha(or 20beta)-hydroxysteroid dehydrogenase
MVSMDNRVVIVTGAASGIGAETARLVVHAGGRVAISDIDDRGTDLAASLGDAAVFHHHDVEKESHWDSVVQATLDEWGQLDGLVNNAASYWRKGLVDTTLDSFEKVLRTSVHGTFLGMKAFANAVPEGSSGAIVNVSSTAGLMGVAGLFGYSTAKWAVRGMSRSAARDLGPRGIRVNCVIPGAADTPMLRSDGDDRVAHYAQRTALRRLGDPIEHAKVILFLLSDESGFTTGAEVSVDGGISA